MRQKRNPIKTKYPKKSARRKSDFNIQKWLFNFVIFSLCIVIIGFMFSFTQRLKQNPAKIGFEQQEQQSDYKDIIIKLAEEKKYLDIKIEVLNGCGVSGVAQEFTNYLRQQGFDVVNFENADHFGYQNTVVIQRLEKSEWKSKEISKSLKLNPDQTQKIFDPMRDVDASIIIGKDYRNIEIYNDILNMGVE